ncbi:DUF4180 domain-containing protein [Sphingobacterium spiritivorum]|uniref:DUF4180 domain-containing protein n=1 Tax=Sphingobacterium spiritivorum TaxID=258 RepID=UPI003DA3EB3E
MNIDFITRNEIRIAELQSDNIEISTAQDALELIMNCKYQDADSVIITAAHVHPDFFDLKTGIAGDILQKFSTYSGRMAIIGDFSIYSSKSLRDFIYESNKTGRINFVKTREEAISALSRS